MGVLERQGWVFELVGGGFRVGPYDGDAARAVGGDEGGGQAVRVPGEDRGIRPGGGCEVGAVLEEDLARPATPLNLDQGVVLGGDRGIRRGDVLVEIAGEQAEPLVLSGEVAASVRTKAGKSDWMAGSSYSAVVCASGWPPAVPAASRTPRFIRSPGAGARVPG